MEPTENYLDTPDGRIHYLDWGGPGRQAHLLHANGFCAGTYSPQGKKEALKRFASGRGIFKSWSQEFFPFLCW